MPFKLCFLLMFVCLAGWAQTPANYQKAYAQEYQNALTFLKTNQNLFRAELKKNQGDLGLITAIVFPEMVRFSEVNNLLETASLEVLYVRFGADYANFSIGRFQMKPSFIESLEKYVVDNQLISFKEISQYLVKEEKTIRQERIKRLKDLTWQLKYLNSFYGIVSHKYSEKFATQLDKIRFFATAYNHGFGRSAQEIKDWIPKKAFPYGTKYKGTQYAYAELAVDFFQRYFLQIFP